jgi:TatD DNase family protein
MNFIDTHCHLDLYLPGLKNQIIKNAKDENVEKLITVGINLESSKAAIEISKENKNVFATVGIHPQDGKMDIKVKNWRKKLEILARNDKVVAVGEAGFDSKALLDVGFPLQKQIFSAQVKIARDLKLPLIIHCRELYEETFEVLRQFPQVFGVLHSFCARIEEAKKALNLGFYLGLNGMITFPNNKQLVEVVKSIPLEKIILETDSPFLTPQEVRGEKNEPKNIKYVAQKLAEIKNISVEEVCQKTTENAEKLFKLS